MPKLSRAWCSSLTMASVVSGQRGLDTVAGVGAGENAWFLEVAMLQRISALAARSYGYPVRGARGTKLTGRQGSGIFGSKSCQVARKPRIDCIDGCRFALVFPIILGHFIRFGS